ncbi:PadR family transcriptional regulator [uncultured Dysosmobacter sp.]|uniref:PadR family transcriptional regulator n=1 Tax=uncultured Dysosmobacter sp. TaxID=2591384 RepID=UPI0026205E37|nr:PadR family transcriptional regulator [uncultured Dysosmobacter sp.]
MREPKEMAKGSHELILLKLLSRKDMYGYQLIQEMALLSENVFRMSQGSLYPFLHALEDKGLIASYTQVVNGRERRFYHLTASGHRALAEKEEQWAVYTRAMGQILEGAER